MTGFEQGLIGIHIHERAGSHSQVISETDDVDDIANGRADLFECSQMTLHQFVQYPFYLVRITKQVHQEVIHPAQEGSPFEEVAAADDHQCLIGRFPQMDGILP